MDKNKRNTYIVAAISFVLIVAAVYVLFIKKDAGDNLRQGNKSNIVKEISEIELIRRPYVTLTPTSDGAEVIISIEKMAEFDKVEFELIYLADNPQAAGQKIQRGATGSDVNPKEEKYKKSILLGTASRGVRSPDRGIIDGKLTLHLYKGDTEYLSETIWDMFEGQLKAQTIKSRDDKIEISLPGLDKNYWIIIADTVGFPPKNESLDPTKIIQPIKGVFSIAPAFDQNATVKINVDTDKDVEARSYLHQESKWETLQISFDKVSKTVTSKVKNLATFVVSSK